MSDSKNLAIISIFYNRSKLVKRCCASLVEHLPSNAILYLVDDGSTDDTYVELKKFESSNVKVITQPNKGFVRTIIDTIKGLDSEFIAIHGSGDIALNDRFRKQYDFLNNHSDYALCGCLMTLEYPEHDRPTQLTGTAFDGDASQEIMKRSVVTHGEVMFRRSSYDLAGGYREFFKFAQDRDLWCRMSRVGKFYVIDEVLYGKLCNISGSVSGTPEKSIVQRLLSEFSVWCHQSVLLGKDDPLERFGVYASLMRPKSSSLEKIFLRDFSKSILMYENKYTLAFLDAACNESTYKFSHFIRFVYVNFPALIAIPVRIIARITGKI
ncbi:glycosyltransferase family A protein [Vibrio furnissii]|uniref:glycosyltransferase family A protein n=1 Tax=Vibrio furnissii TaxID=29494 RepID=UPI003749A5F7